MNVNRIRNLRPDLPEATAAVSRAASGKKPFFKTPWPYVIVAAVAIVLIVASKNKEGGLY